jgi:hypothetical protein
MLKSSTIQEFRRTSVCVTGHEFSFSNRYPFQEGRPFLDQFKFGRSPKSHPFKPQHCYKIY